MSAGETFNAEIDREARAAKAILVCWSPGARQSEWVNAEAMIGFTHKKLAACYVAGPDDFDPPTPFNTSHIEDLRGWLAVPSETHPRWKSVLRRIGKLCGRTDIENWGALDADASIHQLRAWIAAHEASPLFMAVDKLLRDSEAEDAERTRIEREARDRHAIEAADRRNLFAKNLVGPALLALSGIAIVTVLSFFAANVERGNAKRNDEPFVAANTGPPSPNATENQTRDLNDGPVTTRAAGATSSCRAAEAQWAGLRSSLDPVRLELFVQETPRACNARSLALARLVELRRSPPSILPEGATQNQNAVTGALLRPEAQSVSASGVQMGGLVIGSVEQVRASLDEAEHRVHEQKSQMDELQSTYRTLLKISEKLKYSLEQTCMDLEQSKNSYAELQGIRVAGDWPGSVVFRRALPAGHGALLIWGDEGTLVRYDTAAGTARKVAGDWPGSVGFRRALPAGDGALLIWGDEGTLVRYSDEFSRRATDGKIADPDGLFAFNQPKRRSICLEKIEPASPAKMAPSHMDLRP